MGEAVPRMAPPRVVDPSSVSKGPVVSKRQSTSPVSLSSTKSTPSTEATKSRPSMARGGTATAPWQDARPPHSSAPVVSQSGLPSRAENANTPGRADMPSRR